MQPCYQSRKVTVRHVPGAGAAPSAVWCRREVPPLHRCVGERWHPSVRLEWRHATRHEVHNVPPPARDHSGPMLTGHKRTARATVRPLSALFSPLRSAGRRGGDRSVGALSDGALGRRAIIR